MFSKRFVYFVLVLVFLAATTPGYSQSFQDRVRANWSSLTQLEGVVSRIESQKLLSLQSDKDIDRLMYEYAQGMRATFEAALNDAKLLADSKGAKGSYEPLDQFEKGEPEHRRRIDALGGRFNSLDTKIPTGEIVLDRPLLQTFSPSEFVNFKNSLTEAARQKYQKLYVDLDFKQREPVPPAASGHGPNLNPGEATDNPLPAEDSGSAEPALGAASSGGTAAVPCSAPCVGSNWVACATCLANAGVKGVECWSNFDTCWSDCGTKYKYKPTKKFMCRWIYWDGKMGCVPKLVLCIL